MQDIAKIDVGDYFKAAEVPLLKNQASMNGLLLQLTIIVNSIADRLNDRELDKIMKRTEERVARLESIAVGNVTRGPGG